MTAAYYPPADIRSQDFSRAFQGSKIIPNVLVLHTTETGTWPGYEGGSKAPHLTVRPDSVNKRLLWRQHFPLDQSSRALRNAAGGVQTNTLNAVQVEMVGTCAATYRDMYGYFYWPAAPDWALQELAIFVTWLNQQWPTLPIKDAALRGWQPYPASYGNSHGQRLTMAEWVKAYGILGHEHIPENEHGDPGNFNCARLVQFASPKIINPNPDTGAKDQPAPTRVQKARALLREARLRAVDKGNTGRARRLQEALRGLPKR